jgi:hypothetical protein
MPNKLPLKPRAKAIEAHESTRRRETERARQQAESVDWFALWAISLGLAAMGLALIAYFTVGDQVGAAFILAGTAALIALLLTVNERGYL